MSAGTLFVVATPIGNLEDITLRALRVLREADLIAAEDTRRTARLLSHHGIATPTVSFHEHNAKRRGPELIAKLQSGRSIALVTDAGTPGVSDPGVELVSACLAADILVEPVPGASATLTAALASGFPMLPISHFGFPPHRLNAKIEWLQRIANVEHTVTFFEAPHRMRQTLAEASAILGIRPIMVGRELTKLHQEFLFGDCKTVLAALEHPKGEFTVVIGPRETSDRPEPKQLSDQEVALEFGRITDSGLSTRRQAIGVLAKRLGKSQKEIYAAVERSKRSSPQ